MNDYKDFFELIPDKFKTKDLCLEALECDHSFIRYIPKEYLTKEVYLKLLEYNAIFIQYVPEEYLTQEMCVDLIKRKGSQWIKLIPDKFKNEEIYMLIFKENTKNIQYIAEDYITKDMIKEAILDNVLLKYIPKNLLDIELYELAISIDPYNMKFIPKEFKTKELCEKVFGKSIYAIEYIPKEFITKEMCEEIFCGSTRFLDTHTLFKYIPEEFITQEMCNEVLYNYRLHNSESNKVPDYLFEPETYDMHNEKLRNPLSLEEKVLELYKRVESWYKEEIESIYGEELSLTLKRIEYIFGKMALNRSFTIESKTDGIINSIEFKKYRIECNGGILYVLSDTQSIFDSLRLIPSQMLELLNKK